MEQHSEPLMRSCAGTRCWITVLQAYGRTGPGSDVRGARSRAFAVREATKLERPDEMIRMRHG